MVGNKRVYWIQYNQHVLSSLLTLVVPSLLCPLSFFLPSSSNLLHFHFQILSPDTNSRFIPTMEAFRTFHLFLYLFHLLFFTHVALTSAKSQIVDCTMCTSCDNPCQTNPSPPPPTPSPPPPATTTTPACPPPPSSGGGGGGPYYYPPPSQSGSYHPPPSSSGGGGYYYPPPKSGGNYPYTSPPNPIVPYFPFYYYNPPPQSVTSGSDAKIGFSYGFSFVLVLSLYFGCF